MSKNLYALVLLCTSIYTPTHSMWHYMTSFASLVQFSKPSTQNEQPTPTYSDALPLPENAVARHPKTKHYLYKQNPSNSISGWICSPDERCASVTTSPVNAALYAFSIISNKSCICINHSFDNYGAFESGIVIEPCTTFNNAGTIIATKSGTSTYSEINCNQLKLYSVKNKSVATTAVPDLAYAEWHATKNLLACGCNNNDAPVFEVQDDLSMKKLYSVACGGSCGWRNVKLNSAQALLLTTPNRSSVSLSLWNSETGEKKVDIQENRTIWQAQWNQTGDQCSTTPLFAQEKTVFFYDAATGKQCNKIEYGNDGNVLLNQGKYMGDLLPLWEDNEVQLWNTKGKPEIVAKLTHDESCYVDQVLLSPDATTIVTKCWNGVIKSWDAKSFKELKSIDLGGKNIQAAWTNDSFELKILNNDGQTILGTKTKTALTSVQ